MLNTKFYNSIKTHHTYTIFLEVVHERHEHEKMANELKNSKDLMPSVPLKKVAAKGPPLKHDLLENDQLSLNEDDIEITPIFDLQDGVAQTPGGAILSLTLGKWTGNSKPLLLIKVKYIILFPTNCWYRFDNVGRQL